MYSKCRSRSLYDVIIMNFCEYFVIGLVVILSFYRIFVKLFLNFVELNIFHISYIFQLFSHEENKVYHRVKCEIIHASMQ
jgi:hypothetical protein